MKQTFYSNGKLLITGEYVVLDGAKAFALPTQFGQSLSVEENDNATIHWQSYDADGSIWYQDTFTVEDIMLHDTTTNTDSIQNTLLTILQEALKLNRSSFNTNNGYHITTQLTFQRNWGLGTSSTLLNNIAQWLQIDAFILLKNSTQLMNKLRLQIIYIDMNHQFFGKQLQYILKNFKVDELYYWISSFTRFFVRPAFFYR